MYKVGIQQVSMMFAHSQYYKWTADFAASCYDQYNQNLCTRVFLKALYTCTTYLKDFEFTVGLLYY